MDAPRHDGRGEGASGGGAPPLERRRTAAQRAAPLTRATRGAVICASLCLSYGCLSYGCLPYGWLATTQAQSPSNAEAAEAAKANANANANAQPTEPGARNLEALLGLEAAVADAIRRAESSVVAIARERPRDATRLDESGTSFFQERGPDDPDFVPHEFGTGVVLDQSGLIVTNHHVVGDPQKNRYWVWVRRRPFRAEVLAADPWLDLAVLKINANDLKPITLAEYKGVRKGQFVISLGNPYAIARDGSPSAAWGIVSNLARKAAPPNARTSNGAAGETLHQFGTLIQVDCRLQRGTSGGALVNLQGEMIGLTTALAALEGHEAQAGFAIPVDETFRRVVEQLKKGRQPDYGFLGIGPELLPLEQRQQGNGGVRIRQIVAGTPAARSQLRMNDLVTHVDDQRIWDGTDLIRELSRRPAGSKVELVVLRGERTAAAAADSESPEKGEQQRIKVELSKKFIGGGRSPPYSIESARQWRGLQIDYATAIPRFEEHAAELDEAGCVAVLDVQPTSQAWKAGLRPGMFVSHIDQQRLDRPQDFFDAVERRRDEVRLRVVGIKSADAVKVVAP